MEPYSRLLHEEGKTYYSEGLIDSDPSTWPLEWRTTYYKEYPRFKSFPLPSRTPSSDLFQAIAHRKSSRTFTNEPLTREQLGTLLKYSCGAFIREHDREQPLHRAQPSGGARYPIETYVLLFKGSDLAAGVYHYNVRTHALEFMWDAGEQFNHTSHLMRGEWTKDASALIVFTGVFWRNQNKYKARGYRMICAEAGAIIQNMYLVAPSIALKCTALAGTNDDQIETLLDLDTDQESLITSIVIGT